MGQNLERRLDPAPRQRVRWIETRSDAKRLMYTTTFVGTLFLYIATIYAVGAEGQRPLSLLFGAGGVLAYVNAAYRAHGLITNKYQSTQS